MRSVMRYRFCLIAAFAWHAATAQVATDQHGQFERVDIERGSRTYAAQCVGCHGVNGDLIARVDLRRGQFITAVSDTDLAQTLAVGRPAAGMPAFPALQASEVSGLVAFIRSGFDTTGANVAVGDATRGAAIFAGKGECGSCHRVNGQGPHRATDLSDIGALRSPASLQRALLDPASFTLPANRSVSAVTADGRTIRGRRLNEDTFTIQLIDAQDQLVSLDKTTLRSLELSADTSMPSVATSLTADEQSDLIAYLLSLRGQ